jgi:hypothetical protein
MSSITVNSEPGKLPVIDLQPGNTLVVTLAGTQAQIIVNVPLYGFPSCEVVSPPDHIAEYFAFITSRLEKAAKAVRAVAEKLEQ